MLAADLTDRAVHDAVVLPDLMDEIAEPIRRLTADGGYDTHDVYAAARSRGARVRGATEEGRRRLRRACLR